MSSYGYRKAELSPQRQQQLRQERLRKQAQSLLKACQKKLNSVRDSIMKELLVKNIISFQSQISSIKNNLQFSVDKALSSIKHLQQQINTTFSEAEIKAKKIKFEQLKKEAGELLNDTSDMLKHINNPAIQQLIGPKLRQLYPQLKQVSELVHTDPVKAKSLSKNLKKQIQEMLDSSQKQLQKDSQIKAKANASIEQVKQQLEVYLEESSHSTDDSIQLIRNLIYTATTYYHQGEYKQVEESCNQAATMLKDASAKSFDETIRREVVQGLITTLTNIGFIVQPPLLEGKNETIKTVRLIGKLPSGKTASFNVHLDGKMDFDFDGYEGKACAKELEQIDQLLEQQFSIKLSENQITWKNPDKIAKGAMKLPTGSRNINIR